MSYLPNHFQNNALLHVTLSDILTIKVDIVQRKFIDGCDLDICPAKHIYWAIMITYQLKYGLLCLKRDSTIESHNFEYAT